ncbi:Pectinesterase inhibitor [Morella rubra]|uniref:Pectinesterase inhibitor n=1 Tax=Morella rubra TaxID=262757 RepID=A0A6A1VPI0_9ROSI|nr:Pectinesterase inhibitor [Morella rubra]
MEATHAIPLIISFFSLVFFNPAQALCVPRNNSDHNNLYSSPDLSPEPSQEAHPPVSYISAPSPYAWPPYESEPPSSSPSTPPHLPSSWKATPPTISHKLPPFIPTPEPALGTTRRPLAPPPPTAHAPPPFHQPGKPPSLFVTPAIKKICSKTDSPALCISSVSPFLTGKSDPVSVLQMAIKACTAHANSALAAASSLVKTYKSLAPAIGDCKDSYRDVMDNLQNAKDAIPTHDIGTINSMLSAALSDFGTCDDGFTGGTSPLANYDAKGTKLASICLAVASLI